LSVVVCLTGIMNMPASHTSARWTTCIHFGRPLGNNFVKEVSICFKSCCWKLGRNVTNFCSI